MSENSHTDPPDNKKKKPSKMRHTEDEKRIKHENTAEESRLEHEEASDDENILRHKSGDSIGDTEMQNESSTAPRKNLLPAIRKHEKPATMPDDVPESENIDGEPVGNSNDKQTDNQANADPQNDGNNNDVDGKLAEILTTVDKIMPDDRDNVASQAVKHDALETPAAIFGTISEINKMRQKGKRLFFENFENKK